MEPLAVRVALETIRPEALPATARRAAVPGEFEATLTDATRAVGNPDVVDAAESMVGSAVSPPGGGCGCGSMVGEATGTTPPAATADAAPAPTEVWARLEGLGRPVAADPGTVRAGDVLRFERPGTDELQHLAIVKTPATMITPDANGTVGVLPIPWREVSAVQRLL
ncbi:MAG: hypothetical protein S0880_18840 [Actinomycetota bacterium]|nr:hypothetical protein [Actinomycetota bacterium]